MTLFEKLEDVVRSKNNNTYRVIATMLIDIFTNNISLNQKELAKKCFVSESTITKFCYFLGYGGFKDMMSDVKNDYNYFVVEPAKAYSKNVTDVLGKWIENNKFQINNWVNKIQTSQKVNICFSLASQGSANFLYSALVALNKTPIMRSWDLELFERTQSDNNESDLDVFLFFGRDNETLRKNCEMKIKRKGEENILLITSEKQKEKINLDEKNVLTLSFEGSINNLYKETAIQIFILDVFRMLQKK